MTNRISKLGLLLVILLIVSSCSLWAFISVYLMETGMAWALIIDCPVQSGLEQTFGVLFLVTYVFFVLVFFFSIVSNRANVIVEQPGEIRMNERVRVENEEKLFCPFCGTEAKSNWKYCKKCGAVIID